MTVDTSTEIPEDRLDAGTRIIVALVLTQPWSGADGCCVFCAEECGRETDMLAEVATHRPSCVWRRAVELVIQSTRDTITSRQRHRQAGGCTAVRVPTSTDARSLWCQRPAGHAGLHQDPDHGSWAHMTSLTDPPRCEATYTAGSRSYKCEKTFGHRDPHQSGAAAWIGEHSDPAPTDKPVPGAGESAAAVHHPAGKGGTDE